MWLIGLAYIFSWLSFLSLIYNKLVWWFSACQAGDLGSIPQLGWPPGGENGNPLQYSCLGNTRDRGAWQATVHRATKSLTWLSDWACVESQKECFSSFGKDKHSASMNTDMHQTHNVLYPPWSSSIKSGDWKSAPAATPPHLTHRAPWTPSSQPPSGSLSQHKTAPSSVFTDGRSR